MSEQVRDGRVDKADVARIAEASGESVETVYDVLWAAADLGYLLTKGAAPAPAGSKYSFRRIYSDPTGYYYDDWGRAVPVEVIATTEDEARKKGFAMCGTPPSGKVWRLRLDKVEAVTS